MITSTDIRVEVFYSETNGGYIYNVYDLDRYDHTANMGMDWEDMETVRGGLCTGTYEEALEMAWSEAKEYILTGVTT